MITVRKTDTDPLVFYLELEKYLISIKRRSIAYIINCHTDTVATIILYVTGKRGTSQKSLVVQKLPDNTYKIFAQNKEYTTDNLSEIVAVLRSMVQKLSTTLTKI